MKPFGKCGSCKFRDRCVVETQTMAKVIECVYQDFFKKTDTTYLDKRKSKKRLSKV